MEAGAVGLSSGMDYIPSLYADIREISALCEEIAPFDGVYVSHIRGYGPKAPQGVAEIAEVARRSVRRSIFRTTTDRPSCYCRSWIKPGPKGST